MLTAVFVKPAPVANNKDIVAVCDLPGFATLADKASDTRNARDCHASRSWTGCKSYAESLRQVRDGDLSGVAASDKLMASLENVIPLSSTWQRVADVVGGVSNVGAFLAGHPLSMVRRQRMLSDMGPLTVFCSLELSAGINTKAMQTRGAAVLAFVRLLSTTRPVNLYVCCSIGQERYGAHVLVKIDTAPLDLARAAHMLTCPSVTRGLCYATADQMLQDKTRVKEWNGHWAYGDVGQYRRTALDNFKSIIDPTADAVLIPAAHAADKAITQPETWVQAMLDTHNNKGE